MLLAIDMGNTNIVIGCIDDHKTYFVERLSTASEKTELEYAVDFKTVMELYDINPADIDGAIISSVVPPLNPIIKGALKKLIKVPPLLVGPGLKNGLNILMDNPSQLGSDLVVDAVATLHEYSSPAIIIDMGTATTICVLDKQGNYVGGQILPGVQISLNTLVSRTSQLPRINLEAPKKVVGTNTIDCMKSGILFGNASCIDGMIDRIEEELGYKTTVVATGGLAYAIIPLCRHEIILDNDLLLKGLKIIYDKNTKYAKKDRL